MPENPYAQFVQQPGPQSIRLSGPKPKDPPSGYVGSESGLSPIPGGPADPYRPGGELDPKKPEKDPKATEGMRASAGYWARAMRAHQGYGEGMLPRSPVGQTLVDALPDNFEGVVDGPERRATRNYADEFIRAKLRRESGATIPEPELEAEYRTYFPMPGDKQADLERKRQMREQVIEGLKISAGEEAANVKMIPIDEDGSNEAPPPIGEQAILNPGPSGSNLVIDDGSGTKAVSDPAAQGLNDLFNQMVKDGAGAKDFIAVLKDRGVSPGAVMPSVMRALNWRKKNPGYKGDYRVDVETKTVRTSDREAQNADLAYSPLGAAGVAAGNVVTGNRLDNMVELGGGDGEQANLGMQALRESYPGSSLAGDVAGGALLYGGGRAAMGRGGAPATSAFSAPAIAGDAAMGGYIGSGSEGTKGFSGQNALLGALGGAGGGVVGRGAINTTARALSPSGGALAPAYAEGVKPTIGQRMGGVFDRAEQAFASVPLVGGVQRSARNNAVEDWQSGAFNIALRQIDDKLPEGIKTGIPAHAYMQRSFNRAYEKARSGLTFKLDDEFYKDFTEVAKEAAALSPQSQNALKAVSNELENRLRARSGVLSGNDYKTLVSRIEGKVRKIRKNPQGDYELADQLEGLSIALDSGARRHSAPEAIEALNKADRGYVSAVLIEEASRAAGNDLGDFTGKQLEGAVRRNSGLRSRQALRGEAPLQDYAKAGVRLGNSVPDSGTPERLMTMGGMAGVAHYIDPAMLTPWLANTLANLPGGKQAVSLLLSPNRKMLDPARRRLMERARFGGLLAAPAAEAVAQ